MTYLLDTLTLAELLRAAPSPFLVRRLAAVPQATRFASVITATRLLAAARHGHAPRTMQQVVRLIAAVRVLPFDLAAGQWCAKYGEQLPGGVTSDEAMIAATAATRRHVLVTRTPVLFAGLAELRCENWLDG